MENFLERLMEKDTQWKVDEKACNENLIWVCFCKSENINTVKNKKKYLDCKSM